MKLKLIMLVSIFALGLSFSANAGSVADGDSDLVPDTFDNCSALANGPGQGSNQTDSDSDGYGNACDADYDQDFLIATSDFSVFLDGFTGAIAADGVTDHDGDGLTATSDFSTFLAQFQLESPLGPGLSCAGVATPCLP